MEKVWKGDPKKCSYCKKQVFPHSHDVKAWESKKKAASKTNNIVSDITAPRRRGRPPSQKTLELLAICECG